VPGPQSGRRVAIGAAARALLTVTLLLVVYYNAPLNRGLTAGSALLFLTGLALLAVALVLQVRGILVSTRPRLRAIRTLAVGVPLFLVVFAATYFTVAQAQAGSFTEPLSRTDALYFTLTTFATVGFGDIAAKTELARILVMIQMLIGLLAVGVIAKVVLGAVHVAEERRRRTVEPLDPLDPLDPAGSDGV
jgi:voltage-gated potassium channel